MHPLIGVLRRPLESAQHLAEAGAVASVGSMGHSYDNVLAAAFDSLFKAELIGNKGPWKSIGDLEITVAEHIDWFDHRRLHGEIGLLPPAEYEDDFYRPNPRRLPSPRQFRASTEPDVGHIGGELRFWPPSCRRLHWHGRSRGPVAR
jgi:hypothetical protein